jgi:hypothetical protein
MLLFIVAEVVEAAMEDMAGRAGGTLVALAEPLFMGMFISLTIWGAAVVMACVKKPFVITQLLVSLQALMEVGRSNWSSAIPS